jgi:hypothetical protein
MPLPTPISACKNRAVIPSGVWPALVPSKVEGLRHTRYRSHLSDPKFFNLTTRLLTLVLAVLTATNPAFARNPDPPQRIPLAPFGFQTISERYLLQGATMLTVDFVDDSHLLVTFGISRLMPRLSDCPPEDEDRTVRAVLLESPSGKELASTEWRFHDLGQYLWDLGDGHFLLRNRDTLTTFAPLQNLAAKPFAQEPFLHFSRRIEAVIVSASHDLLTIETVKPKAYTTLAPMLQVSTQTSPSTSPDPASPQQAPVSRSTGLLRRDPNAQAPESAPVEMLFVNLLHRKAAESASGERRGNLSPSSNNVRALSTGVVPQLAARVHTDKIANVPLTTEGYLETRDESHGGVFFHFITYAGQDLDLGEFPTSCHPRPTFISHSEFVTYGCRGADDSLDLAGFNLRGDLIWQINFTDNQAYPSFASAPAAGRFAFSRTITTSNVFGSETPSASQLTAQEIRVIQMYNGKQLLRAVANPIQRAGQNYALSPDGLTLAVIHDLPSPVAHGEKPSHDTAVELFKLPAFSAKDLAEMKTEAAMAPPPATTPMRFSLAEIKEALNRKPGTAENRSSDADGEIVGDKVQAAPIAVDHTAEGSIAGDSIAPATAKGASGAATPVKNAASAEVSIPTSDPAPACAGLTEKSVAACPVSSTTKPADQPASQPASTDNAQSAPEPEKRRKPPTLYEPAPSETPKGPQP